MEKDRFPEGYEKPELHGIGEKILQGWAACPTGGSGYDCGSAWQRGTDMFNPEVIGEGL